MYSQCIMYTCVCLTQSVSVILMVFESETVCLFLPKPCTVNKTVSQCVELFLFLQKWHYAQFKVSFIHSSDDQ